MKALGEGFHFLAPLAVEVASPRPWQGGWRVLVQAGPILPGLGPARSRRLAGNSPVSVTRQYIFWRAGAITSDHAHSLAKKAPNPPDNFLRTDPPLLSVGASQMPLDGA